MARNSKLFDSVLASDKIAMLKKKKCLSAVTPIFFSQAKPKTQIVYTIRTFIYGNTWRRRHSRVCWYFPIWKKEKIKCAWRSTWGLIFRTDCLCVFALFAPQLLTRCTIIMTLFTSCNCMLPIAKVMMSTHLKLQFFYH